MLVFHFSIDLMGRIARNVEKKMRVGKSEVDLHVQFDDQEGPPRSQIIEETAKPRKKVLGYCS